jgi:hypothetical protein
MCPQFFVSGQTVYWRLEHIAVEELQDLIKSEKNKRFGERLLFIRMLYNSEPAQNNNV